MPSRTIRPTQAPVAAPFPYTVAAPDGFTPEAVFASWDGSGAGGDFLPCVSYYNADGVLLDRAFPTTGPVAIGGTADVSYRPFDRSGGGGSSGSSLKVTDGVTTVSPTTEIDVGANLHLSNLGGGKAGLSAVLPAALSPRRFIHCQCILSAAIDPVPVLGNGTPLVLDFFAGSGGNYITNDDPTRPGFNTVAGSNSDPFAGFSGTCFTTAVADHTSEAFAILPTPGMYLIRFTAAFIPWPDPGPFRACIYPTTTVATPGMALPAAAATLDHGNVATITVTTVFIIGEFGYSPPAPKTPIGLTLQQFSGVNTDPAIGPTQAEIFCVRLSP